MIKLIGLKKDCSIHIREKFALGVNKNENSIKKLLEYFEEVIVISTCNRTEIYFNDLGCSDGVLDKIFNVLELENYLKEYVFLAEGNDVYKHLFKVACGYHSKILGEDQILGQIKDSYDKSLKINGATKELGRLFQTALTCGKRFRREAKLYEIPVSSASIVASKIVNEGCKNVMVIGYGEVGKRVVKYLKSHKISNIYLAVRNIEKVKDIIGVNIININEKNNYIKNMDCIVSCTSSSEIIISLDDMALYKENLLMFDMAIPRDVDTRIYELDGISLYNIDSISKIDDENKILRKERMNKYRYIIDEYLYEYKQWIKLRGLSSSIKEIKSYGDKINSRRIDTHNRKKGYDELVNTLIKSTSNVYINRAIEVLKEEALKGSEDECLRIIMKIFAGKK